MQQIVQITLQDDGYCDDNKYLYKNQDYLDGKTTEKECVDCKIDTQGTQDLWYIYQKDNVNYHICAVDQGCPNTFKYETTGRQCVTSCKDTDPSYYVVIPVNSNNRSQCQSICTIIYSSEDAVWYQRDDGEKLCTRSGTCPTDEQYQYLLQDTMECQATACDQFDDNRYEPSSDNSMICNPVDLCSRDGYYYPNEPSNYINVCIEECPKVWYFLELSMSSRKVTYRICDLNKNDISCPPTLRNEDGIDSQTQQLTKLSNRQCVQFCKYSEDQTYVIESLNNQSLCVTSCGYSQVDGQQVENVYYTGDNYELKCSSQWKCPPPENSWRLKYYQNRYCALNCSGKFVYQLTDDGYQSYVCSDVCMYYTNPTDKEKYCMKNYKCDDIGGQYPYVKNTNDRRECVSACKNEDYDSVWVQGSDEKRFCLTNSSCNSIYYTVYYKDSSRQCVLFNGQEDKINCPVDTYKNVETAEGEILYSCQINPCSYSDYYYIDNYDKDAYNCIQECNTVWYSYKSEDKDHRICDTSNTQLTCPPTNSNEEYKTNLSKKVGNQCVQNCYDAYIKYATLFNGSCAEDCGENTYYVYPISSESDETYVQCTNVFVCDVISKPPEKEVEKQCIKCDDYYNYANEDKCVFSCLDSNNDNKFASATNYSCVNSCDEKVWYQTDKNIILYQCRNDAECQQNEQLVYETKQCLLETQQCSNAAPVIYEDQDPKFKVDKETNICHFDYCLTFSNYYYQYKYDENAYNCIEKCENSVWYYHIVKTDKYIGKEFICDMNKQSCPPTQYEGEQYQYISSLIKKAGQQCIDKCIKNNSYDFVSASNDTLCDWDCGMTNMYRYLDDDLQCSNDTECDYDKNKEYQIQEEQQCIQESKACLSTLDVFQLKDEENHICKQQYNCLFSFEYYINKYDPMEQCIDICQGVWYLHQISFYGKNVDVRICNEQSTICPPEKPQGDEYLYVDKLTKIDNNQCVQYCSDSQYSQNYFYDSQSNQCISYCINYWYITNDGEYQCIYKNCPPEENESLNRVTYSNRCIDKCSNDKKYQYQINEYTNYCTTQCPYIWRQIDGEKICQSNYCVQNETLTEYVVLNTNECIDITNGCPDNDNVHYIQNDEYHQCVDDICQEYYKEKYIQNTVQQCQYYCDGMWFNYNVSSKRQIKVCRNNEYSCPPKTLENEASYEYLTKSQGKQCVDKCDNDMNFYEVIQDSYICTDNTSYCKQYHGSEQVYAYVDNQTKIYCNYQSNCKDAYPYDKNDLLITYYQQENIEKMINITQLESICSDQCQMKIWVNDNGYHMCALDCGNEPDHFSLDISTYECGYYTYSECMEQYHIETDQYNTKCQYIKGAESCQQFKDYGNYIYQMENNDKLCTTCDQSGYKSNKDICVQSNLSAGAITGIVIACIVVIAVIIVVTLIVIKKKHTAKQINDEEKQHRDIKVAMRE